MVGLFFILIVEKTLNFINLKMQKKVTVTDTDTMVRTQINLKLNKF